MTRIDILKRAKQRPFVPFRIVLTDGIDYDIRHPDSLMVMRDHVVIGLPGEQDQEFFEQSALVDQFHIIRFEPIASRAAAESA